MLRITTILIRWWSIARVGLTLLVVSGGGWLFAELFWNLYTTRLAEVILPPEGATQNTTEKLAGRHLFGERQPEAQQLAQSESYQLLGVITGSSSMAILRNAQNPARVVHKGEEFLPGIKLLTVETREVRLVRSGIEMVLTLPKNRNGEQ